MYLVYCNGKDSVGGSGAVAAELRTFGTLQAAKGYATGLREARGLSSDDGDELIVVRVAAAEDVYDLLDRAERKRFASCKS